MLIKQKKTNQSTDTILRNLSRKIIQDIIVILKSFSFVNAIYVFFVCENGYINALTRTHVKNLKRRRKYPEQITIQRWKSLLLDWKQIGSSSLFNRSKWIIKALGILRFVFFSYFPNIIIVFFLFLQLWCCSLIMSLRKISIPQETAHRFCYFNITKILYAFLLLLIILWEYLQNWASQESWKPFSVKHWLYTLTCPYFPFTNKEIFSHKFRLSVQAWWDKFISLICLFSISCLDYCC